eukprot:COSAG04_NODE_417_length_14700_cov_114.213709_14_plen_210_part_00
MQRRTEVASTRLAKVVRHLVAGAEKTKEERSFTDANAGFSEDARAEHRQRVMKLPRMSKDLDTWTSSELIHRAQAIGASDDTIASLVDAADTKALLVDLVQSLEPPPASSATVEMITVDKETPTERMVEILEDVGALVILNAVSDDEMDEIDAELADAGCWRTRARAAGRRACRWTDCSRRRRAASCLPTSARCGSCAARSAALASASR